MDKLTYYVLDVFTDRKYEGNQLSVVHYDRELELAQYYAIAREFGYSETSFVTYSSTEKALKVRSFTTAEFEVLGAGHNLLGAVCLALLKKWDIFNGQEGRPWVVIGDTKIPLLITEKAGHFYVAMQQRPATVLRRIPASVIAPAIGLAEADLQPHGWEIAVVQTEVAHLMVPVKDRQRLQQAVPNKTQLKQISKEYGFEGFYLFATDQPNAAYAAETRFFNPGMGIDEDPATGTAAGPLAGYLEQLGHLSQNTDYRFLQGTAVKHPSSITVNVQEEGIWVSGTSVIVMEGTLYLSEESPPS